mmetsp:Transcript_40546/g.67751  ORF Transcript_40546/g.67751 Transcript_40546/m.67751 type:complete len:81 (+) Transcript_40546:1977-2219(+)
MFGRGDDTTQDIFVICSFSSLESMTFPGPSVGIDTNHTGPPKVTRFCRAGIEADRKRNSGKLFILGLRREHDFECRLLKE